MFSKPIAPSSAPWDLIWHWLGTNLPVHDLITDLIAIAAIIVAILAYRRSKPVAPEQPKLEPTMASAGQPPWKATMKRKDGKPDLHIFYRTVSVTVLNSGPVVAHNVHLHLAAGAHAKGQEWRLGKIGPDEHPSQIVPLNTSSDPNDQTQPRVWITWTEYPGMIARTLDVPAN